MNKYLFQYCQKIVVFSKDNSQVLLARRKGEADFDSVYSFIGGKMETTDVSLIEGMRREKCEEIGEKCVVKLYPIYNIAIPFIKKDGNYMILPHYYAQFIGGEIELNDEYSEYRWVNVDKLKEFEPKIPSISGMVEQLLKLAALVREEESVHL